MLIKVLQDGPDDAKSHTAWALETTAKRKQSVGAVVARGGVAALATLLQDGPDGPTNSASFSLASIASRKEHVGAVVDVGCVATLAKVLQEGPKRAKRNAAFALGQISTHAGHVGAVVSGWAVAPLVELLNHGVNETPPDGKPDAKQQAALALAHIAQQGEMQMGCVVACTPIAELISVLEQGSEEARIIASSLQTLVSVSL
jgi:HEAT repeat protein